VVVPEHTGMIRIALFLQYLFKSFPHMMFLNAMIGLSMLGAVVSATISSKEASKKVGANQHFLSDYVTDGKTIIIAL